MSDRAVESICGAVMFVAACVYLYAVVRYVK